MFFKKLLILIVAVFFAVSLVQANPISTGEDTEEKRQSENSLDYAIFPGFVGRYASEVPTLRAALCHETTAQQCAIRYRQQCKNDRSPQAVPKESIKIPSK